MFYPGVCGPSRGWNLTLKLTAMAAIFSCAGCASMYNAQMHSKEQNGMNYIVRGDGSPTVVFQSGLGNGDDVWQSVLPAIESNHRVFAYDRPGNGSSPGNNAPRDPCSIAEEERKLLHDAGIHPPYILVGHSLGGLYQFAFAKLYPEDVAGIVLVDATLPYHLQMMQKEAPTAASILRALRNTVFSSAQARELDDSSTCLDRLNLDQPLTLPAQVLVRTEFKLEESGSFETMTLKHQSDWLKLTGADHIQPIAHSGHYIQQDQPQAVIDAIKALSNGKNGK